MKNLIWLQGLSCNGNSISLLNAEYPNIYILFDKDINLVFHPEITHDRTLEEVIQDIFSEKIQIDILVVEGAITSDKRFHRIGDLTIADIVDFLKDKVEYIIAVGNCAVFGNFPAKFEGNQDISGLQFKFNNIGGFLGREFKTKTGYPVINIPGCPIHPAWFTNLLKALLDNREIKLDKYNRPKELFMYLSHDGCVRNEYFEWKEEAEEFGTKEGCLFYNLGCKGPLTHAPCNKILWNRISSKTRAGMPCISCTEYNFPLRENYFETKKNMGIPEEIPLGTTKRAYITITGVAKTLKNDRVRKKLEETD